MRHTSLLAILALSTASTAVATDLSAGFDQYGIGQYPCAVGQASGDASATKKEQMSLGGKPVPFLSGEALPACPEALQPVYPFNKISIRAPDDSLRASIMPFGGSMVEFLTRDRTGTWRDIVLGLDNTTGYVPLSNSFKPFWGASLGRYAGRIKNGTFKIDGRRYHTVRNENKTSTLNGGQYGYDQRSYTIETLSPNHVSLVLHDRDGGELHVKVDANVTSHKKKTPIMLAQPNTWALHGYKDANNTILNHTLHLPKADLYLGQDGILVPDGKVYKVKGTPLDFRRARTFLERFNDTHLQCGNGCQGWDNCLVMSKPHKRHDYVLSLTSPETGIRMRVATDQTAIQVTTCNNARMGTGQGITRKFVHGGDVGLDKVYEDHSCVAIDFQDWSDAINNPSFKRNQIYDRKRPYHWAAEYVFDTVN